MFKKEIYIVINNNADIKGFISIINTIKNLLPDYKFYHSRDIKINKINLLFENFTKDDVKKIVSSKKKLTRYILVNTEFYNLKINCFNSFELPLIFKYLPFGTLGDFIDFFINLKKIKKSKKIKQNRKKLIKKNSLFNSLLKKIKSICNHRNRYLNNQEILKYADIVLCTHEEILKNIKIKDKYLILPIIKNLKFNKVTDYKKLFVFSGELNNYRINFINKINFLFKDKFKNKGFDFFLKNLSNNEKFKDLNKSMRKGNFKYSIHPKKSKKWKFSSPIRYIESINNGEIPIVFQNYNDLAGKYLTVELNDIKRGQEKFKLKNNIKKYNKKIIKNTKNLKNTLKKIKFN